jgi:hypothetical protein
VSYVKQTGMTNNAAATAEGATKPTSSVAVARFQDWIGKITNLERVTDETIEDAPQFWALVQQDGVLGVSRKFEIELLAGVGLPGINGLLNRSVVAGGLNYPSGFLTPTVVTPVTNVVIGGAVGSGASEFHGGLADTRPEVHSPNGLHQGHGGGRGSVAGGHRHSRDLLLRAGCHGAESH